MNMWTPQTGLWWVIITLTQSSLGWKKRQQKENNYALRLYVLKRAELIALPDSGKTQSFLTIITVRWSPNSWASSQLRAESYSRQAMTTVTWRSPAEAATLFNKRLTEFLESKPNLLYEVKSFYKHKSESMKDINNAKKLQNSLN